MSRTARITAVVKIKNGYLWEAVQKCGSVKKLAEYLGLPYHQTINLVNLREYPFGAFTDNSPVAEKWKAVEGKLLLLIGVGFDEIFPKELDSAAFNYRPKSYSITRDVSVLSLGEPEVMRLSTSLNAEDERIQLEELKAKMAEVVDTLTPRKARILRMKFGIEPYDREHTYAEIAEHFGVTLERVRQIANSALRNLRQPKSSRTLEPFAA